MAYHRKRLAATGCYDRNGNIVSVDNLAVCYAALLKVGVTVGEIQDWEVVLSCDLHDPDGNKISLAQIISQQ